MHARALLVPRKVRETPAFWRVPGASGYGRRGIVRYLTVIFSGLRRRPPPPSTQGGVSFPRRASRPEFPCSLLRPPIRGRAARPRNSPVCSFWFSRPWCGFEKPFGPVPAVAPHSEKRNGEHNHGKRNRRQAGRRARFDQKQCESFGRIGVRRYREFGAAAGDEVSLPGFEKFKVKSSPVRDGQNPATGEIIKFAASKTFTFASARAVKDMLNK